MISGINLNETVDFSIKTDSENPTIFKLGMIPSSVLLQLPFKDGEVDMTIAVEVLRIAIKGWENFSVPFQTVKEKKYGREMEVIPLELIDAIPILAVSEIIAKVFEINKLSDGERKN